MKKFLSLLLSFVMVVSILTVAPISTAASAETDRITNQIKETYTQAKSLIGWSNFSGQCDDYVKYQLMALGITSSKDTDVYGNGNQMYNNITSGTTSTGYAKTKYSGNNCLYNIINSNSGNVYNIVVSWDHGYDAGTWSYGHVLFIHAIIDNTVYFSENYAYNYGSIPEGSPLVMSLSTFMSKWNGMYGNAIGAVHFTKSHTHSYDTYVYYLDSHPHYKCYKCSCGEVKENRNEKVVLDTCAYCIDEYKATLSTEKTIYGLGESVTVRWNNISGATHYNLWLYKKESDGTSFLVSRDDTIQGTSFTYSNLDEGVYFTYFQTYNSNFWTEDDTDWFHSRANEIEFEILDPATHNHTHQEYMYYWRDHPHYNCYKCICGDIKENIDEKMVLDTCAYCIDEYKATLSTEKSVYGLGESVTVSWNNISGATHYNLWLYRRNEDGTSHLVSRDDTIQGTSFTYSNLDEGVYFTYFQTYNSNFWTEDDTDWFHSRADEIEFAVIDKSFDEQLLGDTDGDGNVSIMDATFIQRHLAQIIVIAEDKFSCADTDKDGEISVMDATRIQRFIAQLIPQL